MARVIAHTFHEHEIALAQDKMSQVDVATDSYMVGDASEADIEELETAGLVVERVPEPDEPTPTADTLRLMAAGPTRPVTAAGAAAALPSDRVATPDSFLLRLAGPPASPWMDELSAAGVEIREQVEPDRYLARISPLNVATVRGLPFVAEIADAAEATAGTAPAPAAAAPGIAPVLRSMDLVVRSEGQVAEARQLLEGLGLTVAGTGRRKVRFYLQAGSPVESTIRNEVDLVESLSEHVPPVLYNDLARALIGLSTNPTAATLTGQGQVVGIADTGLDENHPDFAGRIDHVFARGRFNDASDPHGHGTHVAGSILGNGSASGGQFAGMAPGAHVVFQSLLDAGGGLGGLPIDLRDLFEESYAEGARIHNDSWGANTQSEYVIDADEADAFVREHPDMLIVTSAGNDGAASGVNEPPGIVDILSIGSLGAAKNVLTVGASRSDRTQGGLSGFTYGEAWPSDFPDAPIRNERVSGDGTKLAGFSSRGPLQTTRIKPDVVAPGTDIVSARSSKAPAESFWGTISGKPYAYMGGTSMSSPLTAGLAALVRQYYVDRRGHDPSAALLKATIVNGTMALTGVPSTPWYDSFPNPHVGFGIVHYPTTVPDGVQFDLEFVDQVDDATGFGSSGQRRRFAVDVGATRELRVCLVYTDAPGRGCQNVLNLFVEHPNHQKVLGNADRVAAFKAPDTINNVEVVRIPTPDPGVYNVIVEARNMLFAPQGFALVVSGDLASGLAEF